MTDIIVPKRKIIQVTGSNIHKYIDFLDHAMQSEFPKDEQSSRERIKGRVRNDGLRNPAIRSFVDVISENDVPLGFIIYHRINTETGSPTSLWEYAAVVGNNKNSGLGTQLFNNAYECLRKEGVQDRVFETEPVPRIVGHKVHEGIEGCYIENDGKIIFAKSPEEIVGGTPRHAAIDRRNNFYENKNGMRIVTDLGYCQPNLDPEIKEDFAGQHRVPLDMQISNLTGEEITQISGRRVREMVKAIMRHNYELGDDADRLVDYMLGQDHQGRTIDDSTMFNVQRYSEMKKSPAVREAYRLLNIPHPNHIKN